MTRAKVYDILLERYGTPVELLRDGVPQPVHAVIQPLSYKSKLYPDESYLPAGYFDNSHYLYLGSAADPVDETVVIRYAGASYRVKRAEVRFLAGEALYQWAILQQDPGEVEQNAG